MGVKLGQVSDSNSKAIFREDKQLQNNQKKSQLPRDSKDIPGECTAVHRNTAKNVSAVSGKLPRVILRSFSETG